MAGFGKADVGLIKATAGAEAGQHADGNLVIGAGVASSVGKIVEEYSKNKASQQKKASELDAAFNKDYQMPDGSLDVQMEEFLAEKMKGYKQVYSENQDGSYESRRVLAQNQRNFKETIKAMNDGQFLVDNNHASEYVPNGMDSDDLVVAGKLKAKDYRPGMRPNASGSGNDFYFAVPINSKKPPIFNTRDEERMATIQSIPLMTRSSNEVEELVKLNSNKEKHESELAEWNRINKLEDEVTVNGVTTYNQEKYTLVNTNEAARYGGVDESRTNMLTYVNQETANFTKDSHFTTIKSPGVYAQDIKKRMENGDPDAIDPVTGKKGAGKIDTRTELNDILFSDGTPDDNQMVNIAFNDDGTEDTENPEEVENSYANMFIYELADPEKHSYMYKDDNGNPIEWKLEKDEPNLVYDITPGSKWMDLSKKAKINLLDMKLRGKDTFGVEKGTSNFDPHQITQYSKFQGIVLHEQRQAQKRTHYEKSGLYFDDGTEGANPYAHAENKSLSLKDREQMVYNQKERSYTNSIVDLAFGNDQQGSSTFINRVSTKDGVEKVEQVLKAEFKEAGMNLNIKSPGKSIEINGEKFDFSDPENAAQTLKDLKQYIADIRSDDMNNTEADDSLFMNSGFIGSKPTSVKEWKAEFDQKREQYYPVVTGGDLSPTPNVNEGPPRDQVNIQTGEYEMIDPNI